MAEGKQSKYKPYPAYKQSGVEWLGSIPEGWEVKPLKYIAAMNGRIGFRGYTTDDIVDEGEGAIVLSPSNVQDDQFSLLKLSYLSWRKYYESPEIIVKPYDILLVKTGSTYGKSTCIDTVHEPMTINPQMLLVRVHASNSELVAYLLKSTLIRAIIDVSNTGSGMPTMTQENIGQFPIPCGSTFEAKKIVFFLNYETLRIDALIARQQRLIALLEEKRQAVISHAVTKGLNPNVLMRPSGIDWLGDVPKHWDVAKVKYYSRMSGGYAFDSSAFKEKGVQLLRIGNLYMSTLSLERQPIFLDKNILGTLPNFCVYRGDILMSLTGTLGKTDYGFAIIVDQDGPFLLNQRVAKLVPNIEKITGEYLLYSLRSDTYLYQLYSLPSGTKQANLSNSDVLSIEIAIPSIDEQKKITDYVIKRAAIFDAAINMAHVAIKLLKERRTALISAAITGKIDLRDWQPPENASSQNATPDLSQTEDALA